MTKTESEKEKKRRRKRARERGRARSIEALHDYSVAAALFNMRYLMINKQIFTLRHPVE